MGSKNTSPIGGYYPTAQTTSSSGTSSGASAQIPDPLAALAYQQTLVNAAQIANTPYQPYQGQQVAGFTPDQIAAMQGYRDIQGITQPYINQASAMTNQAAGLSNPSNFNLGALQQYMNPYQQSVIDATLGQMKQNQDEMFGKSTAESVRRGTYGGSGQALGRAEIARQLGLSNAQTLAQLNQGNYQQAMGQYNQQQQQAIGALMQAAQQQAGLGTTALSSRGAELGGLYQSGAQQQALGQQQLNKLYEQWQQAKAYPYQQTSYFGNLAQGLGPLMGQYGTTSSASTSQGSQQGWQPYQNQSGGGGLAGIITGALGLGAKALSGGLFADGGSVTERTAFAGGGEADSDVDGGYMEKIGKPPYVAGSIDMGSGFGPLMTKTPYEGAPNYIGKAEKTSQVLKPANKLASEKIQSELNKILNVKEEPKFKDQESGIKSKFFGAQDSDSGDDYGKMFDAGADFLKSASKNSKISLGDMGSTLKSSLGDLGSAAEEFMPSFSEGGRVGYADGGSFQEQADAARQAQQEAQTVLGDYKNILGRAAERGGFDYWTNQLASGRSPASVERDFYNSPEFQSTKGFPNPPPVNQDASKIGGYQEMLARAQQLSPGPQLSAAQQGMPSMPPQSYYSPRTAPTNVGGFLNISGSMNIPAGEEGNQTRENFIRSIYQNYFNRDPSQSEIDVWKAEMAKGTAPASVEAQVFGAPEGQQTSFLKSLYQENFGREPDIGGLNYWKDKLLSQGMSQQQVGKYFQSSREYQAIPEAFRSNAPVQGYFSSLSGGNINPETGLFNLDYLAPYRASTYAPKYDLSSGVKQADSLNSSIENQVTSRLGAESGGRISKARGGALSREDIARAALQAGATPREAAILTAIAMPESAGNPYAHNTKGRDNSYGLWQINMLGAMGPERMKQFGLSSYNDLFDPVTNAKAALQLLRSKRGANHWSTYLSGAYRPYYSMAANLVNSLSQDPNAVKAPIDMPARPTMVASDQPHRKGLIPRLIEAFSPISTAHAGESVSSQYNPEDPSGPLRPRGAAENYIRGHERPRTKEELGLVTQPQGYDTFKRSPEWFSSAMGASKDRQMLPETPERVSSADFPMSASPMGTEISEQPVVAESAEAETRVAPEARRPSEKYWGDYRDVEASGFGDLIDMLAGDVKTAEKPGTRSTPMGKYQGQGGLGALFDLEGTNPYEEPKSSKKKEESSDFGSIFDIFG